VELHQQRADFAQANRPVEIDASVAAVERVIAESRV
jgi:hypothetical protein